MKHITIFDFIFILILQNLLTHMLTITSAACTTIRPPWVGPSMPTPIQTSCSCFIIILGKLTPHRGLFFKHANLIFKFSVLKI